MSGNSRWQRRRSSIKVRAIRHLKAQAIRFKLEHCELLERYSEAALAEIYNGIGPAQFPGWLRFFLTHFHPTLAVVALIHDVEWSQADGTRTQFTQSNGRFLRNGFKMARARYAIWHGHRWWVMIQSVLFAVLCQLFGWTAWQAAGGPHEPTA